MTYKAILAASVAAWLISACAQPASKPAQTAMENQVDVVQDYSPSGITAQNLPDLAAQLQSGEITAEEVVKAYLARIERIDQQGPALQSILTLNPDAIEIARALDAKRASGNPIGPLHGIPVLLKDNIESKDNMATTAGALALKDNITSRDSLLTAGLRDAGAIILGKTNLSQWANFRSNQSMSGWSALGGQVRNPHMLDRNPCGSSSGSGSAVAASLAPGAVGTETNGSIICPSNVNGVVGFKPTVGLVPQDYIIPISASQDTAGPMTRTVTGAAMMLEAMSSGPKSSGPKKTDYVTSLDRESLSGLRIGVADFARGSNPDIHTQFDQALADMKAAGAVLVRIEEFSPDTENFGGKSFDLLKYEFKAGLNEYLADTPETVKTRTLTDIIAFNQTHASKEMTLCGQDL
jgi:amidase